MHINIEDCIILYYIILYYIILYYIILYYIILYYIITSKLPTCTRFGHTGVHPQGGFLLKIY